MTGIPYTKRDLMILREWEHEMRWRPDPLLARPVSRADRASYRTLKGGTEVSYVGRQIDKLSRK